MRRTILAAVPTLGLAIIFQIAIASRIPLLSGNADLVLLVITAWGLQERVKAAWTWGVIAGLGIGLVSGIPWYIYLFVYLTVMGMARLLVHRIWQAPLLAMFAVTFIGTLELLILMYVQRTLFEASLSFSEAFSQIILPTLLLNLLLAIPIHALIRDLAAWIFPEKVMG